MDEEIQRILDKYKGKIKENVENIPDYSPKETFSQDYKKFRKEALTKRLTAYESLCNGSERILNIQPKEKDYIQLQKAIEASHLNLTPIGAYSFSIFTALIIFMLMIFINLISYLLIWSIYTNLISLMLFILLIIILAVKPLTNIPKYIASSWRLKVSNQMVLCILYIVMYMRHTSNLDNSIKFSS